MPLLKTKSPPAFKEAFATNDIPLVVKLLSAGSEAYPQKDPSHPDRILFIVRLTKRAAGIIENHYTQNGKRIPKRITEFLAGRKDA